MMESSMQESATNVVDLSSHYTLEAFREFMAYIYYNKTYTGSYLPLLFEILSITDYYGVDAYRAYINDRIIELITNIPICLMIASETQKHGTLTENIYARCLDLLVEALKPQKESTGLETIEPKKRVCYDVNSGDTMAWCCSSHSKKSKAVSRQNYRSGLYTVNGQVACIESTIRKGLGYQVTEITGYSERCCIHRPRQSELMSIDQLPDFIVDDVKSARAHSMVDQDENVSRSKYHMEHENESETDSN
jgi:hypothetical protein